MKILKTSIAVAIAICSVLVSMPASAQQKSKLSDPEIASVAVAANQVDIKAGELAKTKTKNKEVLDFANLMMKDHQSVLDQATALVTKLHVTPKDNAVSKKLIADAERTLKMLSSKSGKAFDKAYINNEVAYHKVVISTLEGVLVPESQNQELRQLLQSVVPAFKAHLEHAQMVQKNYK
jgi:putative membrane protein